MTDSRGFATDWKKIGAALDPPVPAEDLETIAPVLDAIESVLRRLQRSLPADADLWTPADIA